MKKILFCLLAVGLVMGLSTAQAAPLQTGDITLSFNAAVTDMEVPDQDFSIWNVTGRVGVGRFLTNNLQLEGVLSGSWTEIEGEEMYQGALLVRPNYHFTTQSATSPYLGLAAGMYFYDWGFDSETSFVYGAQGGIDYFVKENVYVNAEASYLRTEMLSEDLDLLRIFLGLGFKI